MTKIIHFEDLCKELEQEYQEYDQLLFQVAPDILLGVISHKPSRIAFGWIIRWWLIHYRERWEKILRLDERVTNPKFNIVKHGGRQ